jgi:hypothetical protein
MKRTVSLLLACLFVALNSLPGSAQDTTQPTSTFNPAAYVRSSRLGITHISYPEAPVSDDRYDKALSLGTGWNRWPLYWDRVEPEPGQFDWSQYDRLIRDDEAHGLKINAILLGTPAFFLDGVRISGLHEPIFSDQTDTPRPDKKINPQNPWANFVYETVSRYKPGGILAEESGWTSGEGIRVWEVWNEPDWVVWHSSILDYARLLKTAYLVIKMVDPEAQVMFGGLLFGGTDNWLARVLAIYEDDPFHEEYNWYMDIVGVHSYGSPWRSGWLVLNLEQTLKAYNLNRPVWLNESGVPVWDDYPGPTWETNPARRLLRVTEEQQAYFFIQSTAYAWAQGADVVFFHALFDDCGNQPAGTDFPPHNGELCQDGELCFGDAFGLYRNERGSVCFSQHPEPGTPRPAAGAFQLMAEVFESAELENARILTPENQATIISFDRPETQQRLYVIWSNTLQPVEISLPIGERTAVLYSLDEQKWITADDEGIYNLTLPAATCDYYPDLQYHEITAIGGKPFIVVGHLENTLLEPGLVEAEYGQTTSPRSTCKLPELDEDVTPTPGIDLLIPDTVR